MESTQPGDLGQGPASVGVLGLGYVGLPLGVAMAEAGLTVFGYDVDERRVQALVRGEPGVPSVDATDLRRLVADQRLQPTTDPSVLAQCRALIICVPTPIGPGGVPDLSAVEAATRTVAEQARRGTLVILESTSYPGTTREVVLPPLAQRLGEVGQDFFLAFFPERIDPGNVHFNVRNTPRLVGGVTPACTRMASDLYARFVPACHAVKSPEVAEMAKLLENAFRNVNIALVNELMQFCDHAGLDVDEVIAAAATKPFGYMPFRPGPGIGGECIPVDPHYLAWRARRDNVPLRLLEAAMDINDRMPEYATTRIVHTLNASGFPVNGSVVLLMGVAYKADVADTRNAPSRAIAGRLLEGHATVLYHDPHIPSFQVGQHVLQSEELSDTLLKLADLVVVLTPHSAIDFAHVRVTARRVLDFSHLPGLHKPDSPDATSPQKTE